MSYLIVKIFHIGMVISWFAGLFYLPRIFVNLAMTEDCADKQAVLIGMAERLFRFITPIGVLAYLSGLYLIWDASWGGGWVHAKITAGVLLVLYHAYCYKLLRDFKLQRNKKSDKWYRFFNEIPVLIMFLSIYLVVFKPF